MNKIGTIVCIPAHNEELAIGSVVILAKKYADKVVVIDDYSKDNTAEIACLAGADVISHDTNKGYGGAIKTCFDVARAYDADKMVILDGDGQHNPEDIGSLIEKMEETGSDIVIGSRFIDGNGSNQKIPAYRKMGMKVLDIATMISSGVNVTDSQSGFRAYSKRAINEICLDINGMGVGSEILIKAAEKNLKISEVPIYVRYDIKNTSSENPVTHGLSVLKSIVWLALQKRPMFFFILPGVVLSFAGVVLYAFMLHLFNVTGSYMTVYAALGVLCLVFGAFSVFTGVSLMSIERITKKYGQFPLNSSKNGNSVKVWQMGYR